jgi:azobenzene reductase
LSRPRVLLLGGSLAEPSHSGALLRAAERALAARGAQTFRWDIAARPLQPIEPAAPSPAGGALRNAARGADALVISSPLYHNSYSGAVKDALDYLTARDVAGKPVALLANSGGLSSTQAVDHLRLVVRALCGLAIPQQLVTVDADYAIEAGAYELRDAVCRARLGLLADELLWLAARVSRPYDETPAANGHPERREAHALATTEWRG